MTKTTLNITFSMRHLHAEILTIQGNKHFQEKTLTASKPFDDVLSQHASLPALKSHYRKGMRVHIGIPFEKIILKTLALDAELSDTEIMRFLKSQSTQLFGFPEKQISMDYVTHSSGNQQKIFVVATNTEIIKQLQAVFKNTAIPIHAIDVNLLSMARCVQYFMQTRTFCLLILYEAQLVAVWVKDKIPEQIETIGLSENNRFVEKIIALIQRNSSGNALPIYILYQPPFHSAHLSNLLKHIPNIQSLLTKNIFKDTQHIDEASAIGLALRDLV